MIIPIILSGGNGTRLWPLSNNKKPKQFIKLINDNTLFTETILRFKNKDIYTEPIILSNIKYNELILEELKNNNLYKATIFFEPISRNTAPAIASVVNYLAYKRPNDIALFLPSDAYIDDVDRFTEFLIEGEGLVHEFIGVRDNLLCRVRTDEVCGLCEFFVLCEEVQRLLYEIHGISLLLIGGKLKGVAFWQLP